MKQNLFPKLFLIGFFLLTAGSIHSQITDSLLKLYRSAKHDTIRTRILLNIGEQTYMQDPDSAERTWTKGLNLSLKNQSTKGQAIEITNIYKNQYAYFVINLGIIDFMHGDLKKAFKANYEGLAILKEAKDEQGVGNVYSNFSQFYYSMGSMDSATFYAEKSLVCFKKVKSENLIALTLNNLGLYYDYQGNFAKALNAYFESLKMLEKAKDYKGISYVKHNIGGIYEGQNDLEKAQEYYENSLALRQKVNDVFGIGQSYTSLGSIMRKKNDLSKALEFYNKAITIQEEIHDLSNLAVTYNNIGKVYHSKGETKKATEFLHKSLEIQEKIQDKNGLVYSYNNLGAMYLDLKEYDKAISFTSKALKLSNELGFPENIKLSANQLFKLYKLKGNYQFALENYQLYIKMRDSLNNIETQRSVIKQQTNYEYQQKKIITDAEHKVELKQQEVKAEAEKNKQRIITASVSIVLLLVAVFSIFLYNRFKLTQKQKHVIELKEKETHDQKLIIEEKHKEITDSINYAERIQRSFLASKEILDNNLSALNFDKNKSNYFIFFKPKSIVSGDFYWASTLQNKNFAFVTADSTGHGVPGAIMSLLNITSLEKAVEHYTDPAEILNHTRETIIERLKKDGSLDGGKDGMDCSLMVFDIKNKQLLIAAANNPVWIIRNNELKEINADKMPVGKSDHNNKAFTLQKIDLQKGDTIYTLTDGFADQFGGPLGKKFMSKNLKELLLSNVNLPVDEQKKMLENTLNNWIGGQEQIDDITIIGIKI